MTNGAITALAEALVRTDPTWLDRMIWACRRAFHSRRPGKIVVFDPFGVLKGGEHD